MSHSQNVLFVCHMLKVPVFSLFNIAYAHAHKVFENRNEDVVNFNNSAIVPDYLQDFIYSIIPEVHDEDAQAAAKRKEQKAHETSPQMYFEGWNERA